MTYTMPFGKFKGMAKEIISAGHRALAKVHHPDHDGETRAMQLLNDAVAWLRTQTRMIERMTP